MIFSSKIADGETATLHLLTRDNAVITHLARGAVRSVIGGYKDKLVDQRLADYGLSRDWLSPIQVDRRAGADRPSRWAWWATATEDDGPGILATIFLPLAVTSWLIGGGMGLILDATVGEKERQTIENLLVTPASRVGIVLGKLTVVFIASVAVMGLWMFEGVALECVQRGQPRRCSNRNR